MIDLINRVTVILFCTFNSLVLFAQPSLFEDKGICGGGAATQPAISPHNDQVYYLTSDMSPVFNSTNSGEEWSAIPYYQLQGAGQHTKVEFTSDPSILYSFGYTGYPNPTEPKKSIDGGVTWNVLGSDPTNGQVYQLFADPNTTNRVILCDYNNVYISLDGGSSFSTAFTTMTNSIYIGGVFWDGNDIYVAANNGETGGSAVLWVSNDAGLSFNVESINGDFPIDQYFRYMEGVKVNGQVRLYAITMISTWGGLNFSEYWGPTREVLRLDYGGTWQSIDGNGLDLASGGGSVHPNIIATCTSDPEVVYIGCYEAPGMEVYKSEDGGDTWSQTLDCENTNQNPNVATGWLGAGANTYNWWWSGPVIGMDVANGNSDVIIITDYMSSHHSRDGGASWEALYTKSNDLNPAGQNTPNDLPYESNGLEITSCWDLHWFSPDSMFASYTDIQGFISDDGGDSWSTNYSYPTSYNTTYTVVPSPDGAKVYACVSDKHDMYASTYLSDAQIDAGVGELFESSDKGATWSQTYDFGRVVMDLAIDQNNPNRFYACIANSIDGGIYYSDDYGSNWQLLSSPPRTEGHPIEVEVLDDGTIVAVFSGRYFNGEFTASSGVFISEDNGATWLDRSASEMHYWTMDVEFSPDNDSVWYASVKSHWGPNNNEQGGLYKSINRGVDWVLLNGFYRVVSTTIHPENPDLAYICTQDNQEGLQYTDNLTGASPSFSRVDSYHFANPHRAVFNPFNSDEIWITSFGNGLKKGSVSSNSIENFASNQELQVFPNPAKEQVVLSMGELQDVVTVELMNQLGATVYRNTFEQASECVIPLNVAPGIYFVNVIKQGGTKVVRKLVKK